MWSGPTARLLSEGLRNVAVPCGPVNPEPSPSKLSSSGAAGRLPCVFCSTAEPAAVITGAGATSSGFCSRSASASPGDVPHPAPSQSGVLSVALDPRSERSGGDTSNLAALCTLTAPVLTSLCRPRVRIVAPSANNITTTAITIAAARLVFPARFMHSPSGWLSHAMSCSERTPDRRGISLQSARRKYSQDSNGRRAIPTLAPPHPPFPRRRALASDSPCDLLEKSPPAISHARSSPPAASSRQTLREYPAH